MSNNTSLQKRRSPLQATRALCLECEGAPTNVESCLNPACPLYPYRFGTLPDGQPQNTLKVIATYCLEECQGGSCRNEVVNCQGDTAILGPCPAFPFRLGKNPNK